MKSNGSAYFAAVMLALSILIPPQEVQAQDQDTPDFSYHVAFEGVEDATLRERLEEVSVLNQQKDTLPFPLGLLEESEKPMPLTEGLLKKRAENDLPELLKALHARGFYDATIRLEVEENTDPIQVIYVVNSGQRYHIDSEQIELSPSSPKDLTLPDLSTIKPAVGKPANAGVLQKGAQKVEDYIASHNCLLSAKVKPALRLHPDTHTADAYFEVTAGPKADFGALHITGNKNVENRAIQRLIPWQEGECFHATSVDDARIALLKSGLFATVRITHPDTPNARGRVPMTVDVTERFQHTVKAGVSYMTDQGVGVNAGWEHRNLFGGGEDLELEGVVSALEYSAEANYSEPYFLRDDQSLKLGARIAREDPDAYNSKSTTLTALVDREVTDRIHAGAGVSYRLSEVKDIINGDETYGLISLPLYGTYDSRDDILDPQEGINARLDGEPYFDTLGTRSGFFKTLASGSTYFGIPGTHSTVLAVRGTLGSIAGASLGDIPADLRLYAGGGSSVRGYGYQELSPMAAGQPIGGKSLLETSAELRFKVTKKFGGAVFLDGGNAFESEYPDFHNSLRWGAGVGVRYYSAFGPLRLDVAVPLNRRPTDSAFQLYVSLGQAF